MTLKRSLALAAAAALGIPLGLLGAARGGAQDAKAATDTPQAESSTSVYRPPARGKPRARVGGGVRGPIADLPSLQTLVPEHAGLTVSEQPALFWHVDGVSPESASFVFTLLDDESVEPLVEVPLARPEQPGIQRIDLADRGVRLQVGSEYEWSVALVVDAEQRSQDLIATGWIDRVPAPAALGPPAAASAGDYAANGLWYDALTAAADGLAANPGDTGLLALRGSMLREVGLGALAPLR